MITARQKFSLSLHKVDLSAYASFSQTSPAHLGDAPSDSSLSLSDLLPPHALSSQPLRAAAGQPQACISGRVPPRATAHNQACTAARDRAYGPAQSRAAGQAHACAAAPQLTCLDHGSLWQGQHELHALYKHEAAMPASGARHREACASDAAAASAYGDAAGAASASSATGAAGAIGSAFADRCAAREAASGLHQSHQGLSRSAVQRGELRTLPAADAQLMARLRAAAAASEQRRRRISARLAAEVGNYLDFLSTSAAPEPERVLHQAAPAACSTDGAGGASGACGHRGTISSRLAAEVGNYLDFLATGAAVQAQYSPYRAVNTAACDSGPGPVSRSYGSGAGPVSRGYGQGVPSVGKGHTVCGGRQDRGGPAVCSGRAAHGFAPGGAPQSGSRPGADLSGPSSSLTFPATAPAAQ